VAADLGAALVAAGPGLQRHLGDGTDRRQALAAESQGADGEQFAGVAQFAGGVGGEGQRQVVGLDAAAVIDDAEEVEAALADLDVESTGAGVDAVLEQFLEHAGGPLDDLARGDLSDDVIGQDLDATHDPLPLSDQRDGIGDDGGESRTVARSSFPGSAWERPASQAPPALVPRLSLGTPCLAGSACSSSS